MGAMTQGVPGYYVWEIPGKPVAIHLHLEVVDRLLVDVMRGFGAVRKRGAEIGGLLIGTIEPGDPTIVRIEDFESIECGYKRGPSYLFTERTPRGHSKRPAIAGSRKSRARLTRLDIFVATLAKDSRSRPMTSSCSTPASLRPIMSRCSLSPMAPR